ncbi:MAG TPA: excinuclease ABC subunit A [Candidatus Udaeobacter sp.]|nr:excinuclease ABC subunit A [Candidatus Udaeobacter sp.]
MGSKIGNKERVITAARNDRIEICGARQNNLKAIDIDVPLGKLTVVTGPSGSGKSSLAFQTIYAEGQRRYVETFSPYMRQFLDRMDKPRVDDIRGIPPAIAIEQSNSVKTSRSTVGTMTEINDYLKLLWPRIAHAFCPSCGREIRPETAQSIADQVLHHFGTESAAVGTRQDTGSAGAMSPASRDTSNDISASLQYESSQTLTRGASTSGGGARAPQTVLITFWVAVPAKTEPRKFFDFLQQQGYMRIWIDNKIMRVDEPDPKIKNLGVRVQVVQDRIAITGENRTRLVEAIETALRFGKGQLNVIRIAENAQPARNGSLAGAEGRPTSNVQGRTDRRSPITDHSFPFSAGWHCAWCDLDIRPPTVGLFSFNNPLGACPDCRGFGRTIAIDLNKAIPDRSLSIKQGVVRVFRGAEFGESQKDLLRACAREDIDINLPFDELPKADQDFVIEGERRSGEYTDEDYEDHRWYGVRGFFRWLESKTYKMHVRVLLSRYRAYVTCPKCNGGRYQPEALNYRCSATAPVASLTNRKSATANSPSGEPGACPTFSLPEFLALSISQAHDFLRTMEVSPNDKTAEMLRDEICARLNYLCEVGVGYLTLDRSTRTLSGGEVQRVNLTTCLGASLANTLFVMDEPSVGLHPRDVGQLVRVMHNLRDKGNTLLVVEHEEQIIRAADNLIDLGPGRGEQGGELVWNGPLDEFLRAGQPSGHSGKGRKGGPIRREILGGRPKIAGEGDRAPQSLTHDYLTGRKSIPVPTSRRKWNSSIKILGAHEHNLKSIDVALPLGVFACVTGVSGSGKSTLIHDVLYRNLLRAKGQSSDQEPGACKSITGTDRIGEVVMVDQSPLARTPRSTPILYLGLFDQVRELFAGQPDAIAQGLTAGSFSFNSGNGRCERCSGTGHEKIEMQFLSDLYVRCAECEGKRFQPHVLKVRFRGRSIQEVLELTIREAIQFFAQTGEDFGARISDGLRVLEEVGLGYLRLGQPLNTLSGGESQRLKLVGHLAENAQRPNGKAIGNQQSVTGNLFIFDEPTTGLHFDDVALLLQLFQRLVDRGHSLVVIEHNLEVIKSADWIIDLGPEAGDAGGEVVATGTPEQIATIDGSHTGKFLRRILSKSLKSLQVIPSREDGEGSQKLSRELERSFAYVQDDCAELARAAETAPQFRAGNRNGAIHVRGAREHNLKNIDLKIPREQLVVITGLSGSGKSTVAFDILFAEGQRRFLDSMSPYARQFVEQLEKPDVDLVSGLPPTVAIEQRVTRGGGKSTVATVTEVYHFLRLLFAKTGTQFCPDCDLPVQKQSAASIVKQIETAAKRGPLKVLAPLIKARKGFHTDVARWAERQGFDTLYVDGKLIPIGQFRKLERFKEHTIDVVVGVISVDATASPRSHSGNKAAGAPLPHRSARDIAHRALEIGRGTARLLDSKNRVTVVSTEMSCPNCGRAFEELDPRLFSFNSPHGMCQECGGFGEIWDRDLQTGANRDGESVLESELAAERESEWIDPGEARECPGCHGSRLNAEARHVRVQGYTIDQFTDLSAGEAARAIAKLKFTGRDQTITSGLIPEIQQRLRFMETVGLGYLALGRSAKTLSGGESQRIRLAAQLGSNLRGVLYVLDEPTIGLHPRDNERLLETLTTLRNKGNSLLVVEHDEETMRRADHIVDLGPRAGIHGGEVVTSGTLSEVQKNLKSETARCLKSPLCHPIRGSRRSLRDVEKWIEIHGARANNLKNIEVRFPVGRLSVITGISGSGKSTLMHSVLLPQVKATLGSARVSRAGEGILPSRPSQLFLWADKFRKKKSSLPQNAAPSTPQARAPRNVFIEAVYEVDQSPIGKTSRSTPGTYVKVFDEIRNLYAQLPVSRMRGYSASRFSFNAEGGRCETCKGQGVIKLEMNFLPSSYVSCEDCHGRRYNPQTLEVLYNEKSIGDVMEMTIEEAAQFFSAHPKIARPLSLLVDTGLGYLKLGQPSPTLSGGEAQRLKLVTQLKRGVSRAANERIRKMRKPGSTLYLLEEPTIGLHMADIELLLNVIHRLVDEGNTVIIIEHNLSVIAEADYIVDLGPEAGANGGQVVASGTPEQVATNRVSRTAPFLRKALKTAGPKAALSS